MSKKPAAAAKIIEPAADMPHPIGDNKPPLATPEEITADLTARYSSMLATTSALLDSARAMPVEIPDATQRDIVSDLYKEIINHGKAAELARVGEKEPWLSGERAVDGFFKTSHLEKLEKTASILHKRVDTFNKRILEEERQKRAAALAAEQAAQREAEKKANEERAAAQERIEAAARARKPENIEAHQEAAAEHAGNAEVARVETIMATDRVREATIEALQKPADIVRARTDSGVLTTMAQVGYVEIINSDELDMKALWPFIKEDAKLAALKAYAKIKNYKATMPGAIIEFRDATVIR